MGKVTAEIEMNAPLSKVWKAFHDPQLIAKALPDKFQSVEVVEGDGVSSGSTRKLVFPSGSPHGEYLVEKIVSVHKDSHQIVTEQIEGGMIGKVFKFTKVTFRFHEDGAHKTNLIWEFEYETLVAEPPVEQAKAGAIQTIKSIQDYIISSKEYD